MKKCLSISGLAVSLALTFSTGWAAQPATAPMSPLSLGTSQTPNLMDALNEALNNDPVWLAQKSTLLANQENLPIARSLLLPSASLTGTSEYNHRDNQSPPIAGFPNIGVGNFSYNNSEFGLNVSQVVFNFAEWSSFQQSKATVKQATAEYGAAYQTLMVQVSQLYFNVLQARDVLDYTRVERQAVAQLYNQNLQRYKVGLGTITDVYDAKAQLDNIISQEIAAKAALLNANEALTAITGQTYTGVKGLQDNIPLMRPNPENLTDWLDTANRQNLNVLANQYAVDAAKEQVNIEFSGHLPTLNAVGSYTRLIAGDNGTGKVNETDGAVGLQLNIPIFTGGQVIAQTQQAQYNYQTALSNLEATLRQTTENTSQQYNNVVAGANQIQADRQAIISNESSLKSTEAAFKVGTRTIVDVLQAQTQLFDTQVNYATDLYSYLLDVLQLKQQAGTLSPQDLSQINQWLIKPESLSGYYGTLAVDQSEAAELNAPMSATGIQPPTAAQQAQIQKALQNLPMFTPQPKSQWTTPVAGNTTPTVATAEQASAPQMISGANPIGNGAGVSGHPVSASPTRVPGNNPKFGS